MHLLATQKGNSYCELYLQGDTEALKKLKSWIIFFFYYRQYKYAPDNRYERYINAIVNTNLKGKLLPRNNNIISWNYDLQFEIAFSRFLHKDSKVSLQDIYQHYLPSPNLDNRFGNLTNKPSFQLVRLNGVAAFSKTVTLPGFSQIDFNFEFVNRNYSGKNLKSEALDYLIAHFEQMLYLNSSNYFIDSFTYSWEENERAQESKQHALKIMNNTSVLIILGYSFPEVNWYYDSELLKACSNIKTVVFQNPDINKSEYKDIMKRVKTTLYEGKGRPENILTDDNKDEFYNQNFL